LSSHLWNLAHWSLRFHIVPVHNILRIRSVKKRGLGVESLLRNTYGCILINDECPFNLMQLEVRETILLLILIMVSVILVWIIKSSRNI
jgi:hypothetical protein